MSGTVASCSHRSLLPAGAEGGRAWPAFGFGTAQRLSCHSSRRQLHCQHFAAHALTSNAAHWRAAEYLVKHHIKDNQVVALGSGPLAAAVIESIAGFITAHQRQGIRCIAASDAAAAEAAVHGLTQTNLDAHPEVDVLVCEADCIDSARMAFVVGCIDDEQELPQQPQLLRFARLRKAAHHVIALVDDSTKVVTRLKGSLPVAIQASNWEQTAEAIDDIFVGDAEIWRRSSEGPANPRGGEHPYTSPEGHQLLDIKFDGGFKLYGKEVPYGQIAAEIEGVAGVVAHGLVVGADMALIAEAAEPRMLVAQQ
ncbi:hypothetical protein WJX73_009251 [Symbiochloris irregularis]|uniref:ribose-5-phosphate isomerase n=1 Tax=Symbiochloris irregularis TaxID=706552 RepID=A0AAW1NWJ1_9CHLO